MQTVPTLLVLITVPVRKDLLEMDAPVQVYSIYFGINAGNNLSRHVFTYLYSKAVNTVKHRK